MYSKRLLLCFCFVFINYCIYAQIEIKGIVYDDSTNKPVDGASVFLTNTSFGTVTDKKGNFKLNLLKQGTYTLVVSSVGYNTYTKMILVNNNINSLTVSLKQKTHQLKDVIVKSYDKDGWTKYGKFFLENFIGTSKEARKCELKNTSAVKFYFSQKKNQLIAFSDEPLIIENKALGYIIKYQLENFIYNYDSKYLSFTGYPLFTEMKGSVHNQERWQKEREDVYEISIMRFMRALFANKLIEKGYDVLRLKRNVPNIDKQKLEAQEKLYYTSHSKDVKRYKYETTLSAADHFYYKKVMAEHDSIDIINYTPLSADSIVYTGKDAVKGLIFSDYLLIIYPFQKPPPEYHQANPGAKDSIYSVMSLPLSTPVIISADGAYYNVQDLLYEGFWAWWQRIATMLPFDYELSEKQQRSVNKGALNAPDL